MVGNLELVLPELEAQDITAKDFFMIHLGCAFSRQHNGPDIFTRAGASQPQRGAPSHPIQA